jgi:alpha-tubulin suppressor-like RCC1 family protein
VGQLGNGATNNLPNSLPARILLDNNNAGFSNIVMLAARDWHNIAVKADGSVWQWGANDQGQCGDNTTIDRWRPVQVNGLGPRVGRVEALGDAAETNLVYLAQSGSFLC